MHYWHVDPANAPRLFQLFYASQILYVMIQVCAKVAILVFYNRIFTSRWFKITVRIFIAFLVGHGLIYILLCALQCMPVRSIWDRNIERKCLDVNAMALSGAAFSIVEDIAILILPIPDLLKLQFGMKSKVSLLIMFSIGSL
jgi:hypothetical protein